MEEIYDNKSEYTVIQEPIKYELGARITTPSGYVHIRMDYGWQGEHRLIMEQALGRRLARNEVVHHINGIRNDNRLENLALVDAYKHRHDHWNEIKQRRAESRACFEATGERPTKRITSV